MVKHFAMWRILDINRRISRCNDVIDNDTSEASFAVRPLRASCIRRETLDLDRDRKYEQDCVVTDLEDETGA
jgi:hypothetical protein